MTVRIRKNTSAFAINHYARGAQTRALNLEKEVMKEIFWELLIRTPVKTGLLVGSWYASMNKRGGQRPGVRDPSGQVSYNRFAKFVETHELGGDFIVYNTQKYAKFQEWGTVSTPPAAMVRRTLRVAPNVAQRVIARQKGFSNR